MEEQTNLVDFKSWLESFTAKPETELKPTVSYPEDAEKVAVITNYRPAKTKYGEKLVLELKFEDGTEKVIFLGKLWTKDFIKFAGSPEHWKGMKVKLVPTLQYNPSKKESIRKLFPNPVFE